jgi:hypothetical protein
MQKALTTNSKANEVAKNQHHRQQVQPMQPKTKQFLFRNNPMTV